MLLLPKQVSTGPVAQWIRHRPTELGIVGSSPTGVIAKSVSRCCSWSRSQLPTAAAGGWLLPRSSERTDCRATTIVDSSVANVFYSHHLTSRPRGPMDKASAHGAGDCRLESYRGHCQVCVQMLFLVTEPDSYSHSWWMAAATLRREERLQGHHHRRQFCGRLVLFTPSDQQAPWPNG